MDNDSGIEDDPDLEDDMIDRALAKAVKAGFKALAQLCREWAGQDI
jgi:hypothetical protein